MKYWNYNRATNLWAWWHEHICIKLRFRMYSDGLGKRKTGLLLLLGKAQMPICRWLDGWSHGKEP